MSITVHGVLAGAYRGTDISKRTLLTHASTDEGLTAVCSKRVVNLCDEDVGGEPTCPRCRAKLAKVRS